jgi:hypothetical protein
MSRILTPGGRILMSVPFIYPLHESPYDYYRYTEYSLQRFAESAGFQMLLLKSIGGTPEVLADIIAKHIRFLPVLGPALAIGMQSLTLAFVRTDVGRKLSERTGKVFPLGYFLIAEKFR